MVEGGLAGAGKCCRGVAVAGTGTICPRSEENKVIPEFGFALSQNHPITVLGGEQHQFL